MFTLANAGTWVVVGLIGGGLAGMLVKRSRAGFGLLTNIGLGCVGALIGGALFNLFGLFPGMGDIVISLRDVVAAFVGSLVLLVAIWLWGVVRDRKAH